MSSRPKHLYDELTLDILSDIIDMHEDGVSIGKAIQRFNIRPSHFYKMLLQSKNHALRYRSAQLAYSELIAGEVVDIADEDNDAQRANNRINARKWVASKYNATKFGDKLDLNMNQTVDVSSALKEAKERAKLEPSQDQENKKITQSSDITDLIGLYMPD